MDEDFARWLRTERARRHLTIDQAAERGHVTFSRWLRAEARVTPGKIPIDMVQGIARAFDLPPLVVHERAGTAHPGGLMPIQSSEQTLPSPSTAKPALIPMLTGMNLAVRRPVQSVWIRQQREELGMTIAQAAEKAELTESEWARMELSLRASELVSSHIGALARALSLPIGELRRQMTQIEEPQAAVPARAQEVADARRPMAFATGLIIEPVFASWLREQRGNRRVSMAQAAEQAGLSFHAWLRFETTLARPRFVLGTAQAIARVLGLSPLEVRERLEAMHPRTAGAGSAGGAGGQLPSGYRDDADGGDAPGSLRTNRYVRWLGAWRRERGLSPAQAARNAGLPLWRWLSMEHGLREYEPSAVEIQTIATGLQTSVVDVREHLRDAVPREPEEDRRTSGPTSLWRPSPSP